MPDTVITMAMRTFIDLIHSALSTQDSRFSQDTRPEFRLWALSILRKFS